MIIDLPKNEITKEMFEEKVGLAPTDDDLERANCFNAGKFGHFSCGWCEKHDGPMTQCLCGVKNNDS